MYLSLQTLQFFGHFCGTAFVIYTVFKLAPIAGHFLVYLLNLENSGASGRWLRMFRSPELRVFLHPHPGVMLGSLH
jgi:hypothetical protein